MGNPDPLFWDRNGRPCRICKSPFLVNAIDPLLDDGMSAAGLDRMLGEQGIGLSEAIIRRHRLHYRLRRERKPGQTKRDFAIQVRDAAVDLFAEGKLALTDKDHVSGINAGLKAQSVIDKRAEQQQKGATAELAFAIINMLGGAPTPLALDDGMTIDGEATEVFEDDAEDEGTEADSQD